MTSLLGGMSPAIFLRDHWQKKPLLVRQAIPRFSGLLDRDAMLALACRTDATSRLVLHHPKRRDRWERHDGPFAKLTRAMLPRDRWTLLVHGLESLVPGGWELLNQFAFIPAARVDDLMVSYATDGGGVGPHDDKYDVFLLQGPGRRRWRISTQADRSVDEDASIRVLRSFVAEEEWTLEPGDMLYLPPDVAHEGVAEGECFTYSIGFLAPSHDDLVQNFLGYLGEKLQVGDALYEDPDLAMQRDRLAIESTMVARVARVLDGIRWDDAAIGEFLGRLLTAPKPHFSFTPPRRAMSIDAFARRKMITLALPSRGLVRDDRVFFNGESHRVSARTKKLFSHLVRDRRLALPVDDRTLALFYGWYELGYLSAR